MMGKGRAGPAGSATSSVRFYRQHGEETEREHKGNGLNQHLHVWESHSRGLALS